MNKTSHTTDTDLRLFQQSLERVGTDSFYADFYTRLFGESAEVGAFFHNRDIPSIIAKLRVTLGMVADTAEGKPGLEMYLEMLGSIHRRLEVAPRFFTLWRQALLTTVSRHDPAFDQEILGAWERVIDRVIECMHQTESKHQDP